MIVLTLAEIAAVTSGDLHDVPDPAMQVTGRSASDSRHVGLAGMFVAIKGERVDGHDYAEQAIAAGAACVLASRPVSVPAVVIDDVTAAMGRLAQHVLTRTTAQVIALTGSAGKTTTKDLLAQVLAQHGETIATAGSFNTEIGLPLTVLRADESTRYLVLEMATRHPGDIAYLATLTRPSIGIVLNIGTAHVGQFGSREAIAAAKGELVEALPDARSAGGIAILNADDNLVAAMSQRTAARVLTYGTGDAANIRAPDVRLDRGRAAFTLHTPLGSAPVALRLLGAHQIHNALAVAAASHVVGMTTAAIAEALSAAAPISAARLQILERSDGVTIINDAFNANPESMRAGLETLQAVAQGRRMIAVLGPMGELGDTADAAHHAIGQLIGDLGIDTLVTVGTSREIAALAAGAFLSSQPPRSESVDDPEALLPLLNGLLRSGDVVLVKASRFVGLEHFADTLQAQWQNG